MEVKYSDNSNKVNGDFDEAVLAALTAIGMEANRIAAEIVPVDTGRLKNSIARKIDGNSVYIGTNVEYAEAVELGTSRSRAKPYIRPAVYEHTGTYKNIIYRAFSSLK